MKYQLMISEQMKNKVLDLQWAKLHPLNSFLLSTLQVLEGGTIFD